MQTISFTDEVAIYRCVHVCKCRAIFHKVCILWLYYIYCISCPLKIKIFLKINVSPKAIFHTNLRKYVFYGGGVLSTKHSEKKYSNFCLKKSHKARLGGGCLRFFHCFINNKHKSTKLSILSYDDNRKTKIFSII